MPLVEGFNIHKQQRTAQKYFDGISYNNMFTKLVLRVHFSYLIKTFYLLAKSSHQFQLSQFDIYFFCDKG